MKNELFTIGPLTVYGYGFMIATGVLAAWIVTEYRAKKQNLDSEHVFSLVLWCLMGGLLFAKLLFWITEWKSIAEDPGWFCCIWRNYRRYPGGMDVLSDQKSRFLEIF